MAQVEHRRPRPVLEVSGVDPLPEFTLYPLPDQVADKICAMYERHGPTATPSSRFRDLVDLVLIVSNFELALEELPAHRERGNPMKKLINAPDRVVTDMLSGYLRAYAGKLKQVPEVPGVVLQEKKDKVAVLIGGGSGHEPLFLGFIGEGLSDGVALGHVFASPPPTTIHEVTKAVDAGKGVLYVYGNYAGDNLNFDMAAEFSELDDITVASIRVWDDVASAPPERTQDRRGIAGDVFVIKIAGAAATRGMPLQEVVDVATRARDNCRSIGIALSPGSIPGSGKPTFTIEDDMMEFGMGLHGEPGVKRTELLPAADCARTMVNHLLEDLPLGAGDSVVVLVNGLGSTTLMEQYIINNTVAEILAEKGVRVHETLVGSYCTCQEMAGVSLSFLRLDDELTSLWDDPCDAPHLKKSAVSR